MTGEESDTARPATLVWAVRLLLLEAAGLAVLAAYLVVMVFSSGAVAIGMAVAVIVLTVLGAAAVVVVARSLGRLTAGARGPAIVVQLFVIASGGFLLQTGPAWLGLPMMALGLLVGLLIVLPPSTRALGVD